MSALRVYDSDFMQHGDELIALARLCAREYVGNWSAMCEWKRVLSGGGYLLADKEARQILNMVLSDVDQYVRHELIKAIIAVNRGGWHEERRKPKPKLTVVREPERSVTIRVKARINVPFAMPKMKNGSVHLIKHAICSWNAEYDQYLRVYDYDNRIPHLYIYAMCGRYYTSNFALLTEAPEGRRECKKCKEVAALVEEAAN